MSKEIRPLNKEEIRELEAYGNSYYNLIEIFTNPDITQEKKGQYLINIENNFPASFNEIAKDISMSIQSAAIRIEGINKQIIHYSTEPAELSDNEKLKLFYIELLKNYLQRENNNKEIPQNYWHIISKTATLEISELGYPLLSLSEEGIKILERLIGINIGFDGLHYSFNKDNINLQFIITNKKNNEVLRHELHHAIYQSNKDLLGLKEINEENIPEIVFDRMRDELIAYLINYKDGFEVNFDINRLIWGLDIAESERDWLSNNWPEVKKELLLALERFQDNDVSPLTLTLPIAHSSSLKNMKNIFKNILPNNKEEKKPKKRRTLFDRWRNN